ncbi:hypothetical protein HDU97_009835 [Phlyctochytrium planicorne]|nr:hypothetical protein HDU97_009835 [Phlyctochytrium planicorne]
MDSFSGEKTELKRENPHFSPSDIQRLAKLASLEIKEEEMEKLTKDVNDLCAMVEPIKEIDTKGVEPMISVTHRYEPKGITRSDSPRDPVSDQDSDATEHDHFGRQLLRHAPHVEGGFYVIQKAVLGNGRLMEVDAENGPQSRSLSRPSSAKASNRDISKSKSNSRSNLKRTPSSDGTKSHAEDAEYKYAMALAEMSFGLTQFSPAGQDAEFPRSLEREKSSSSLKRSTSSLGRSRAGSIKIPQIDGATDKNASTAKSAKSNMIGQELQAMAPANSQHLHLDMAKSKSVAGAASIIRSQPNHGQAISEKLKDLSFQEADKGVGVMLPAIESASKPGLGKAAPGAIILSGAITGAPIKAPVNKAKVDSVQAKPAAKPEVLGRPSTRQGSFSHSRSSSGQPPPGNLSDLIITPDLKHTRRVSEETQDNASEAGSTASEFRYLTPHEIRERMLQYQATNPDTLPEKRPSTAMSNTSSVSTRSQKPNAQPVYDGRPNWKPAGGMDAAKRDEFMKNRLRAKEIADRTRKEILASNQDDSDEEEDVDASEDSIKDALGPFSRPATAGPPPVDQKGKELPTANTFAHTMLKVMDKYDAPIAKAGQAMGQAKALTARPTAPEKKIISYPVPQRKRKPSITSVKEALQPEPVQELEEPPVEPPPPPPEPKEKKPEPTPVEKLKAKVTEFVSKIEEEHFSPRPQVDERTPHELRMIFVNDFSVLDTHATNQRNNEMAMLIRDVDVVPTGIIAPLSPDQEDEEEEHKMFEIKRLIARLPEKEFIKVKAIIGHIERLANSNRSQGITLHSAIASIFAPVLLRRPCRKTSSSLEAKTPFDRVFRAGSAYTVNSRHSAVTAPGQTVAKDQEEEPIQKERDSTVSRVGTLKNRQPLQDAEEKDGRSSTSSIANYGSLKKKRDVGASMGHMIVAGVTLQDPALDPAKWENLTVASEDTGGGGEENNWSSDVLDQDATPSIAAPPASVINEEEKNPLLASAGSLSAVSDDNEDEEGVDETGDAVSTVPDNVSVSFGRPSSAATGTTARSRRSKKGVRPVPGFRNDFPDRDATTPLMPPSISPRELLAIITNQAEREETEEMAEDEQRNIMNSRDEAETKLEAEFGALPMAPLNSHPSKKVLSVTVPLTRLSTMTEVDSVTSNMSMMVGASKMSTSVRPTPSAESPEESGSPGGIDFGEEDPDGFGWNLLTRKGIAEALFLEETVNTAQAAALEIMLKNYAAVFAWNTFQQNIKGSASRTKASEQ